MGGDLMEISITKKKNLLGYQKKIIEKIVKIADYVYRNQDVKLKFSGFLLYGPPGSGKTEIAKQAALMISEASKADILLVDGSDIASPRWGDAEEKLKKIFLGDTENREKNRRIIIFDDIESTLMGRDMNIAKEWHFSINSVSFHLLDELEPYKTMVIATTNKPEMVDPALKSRLYEIFVDLPTKDDLKEFLRNSLAEYNYGVQTDKILKALTIKIDEGKIKTLRDIEHEILLAIIEEVDKNE